MGSMEKRPTRLSITPSAHKMRCVHGDFRSDNFLWWGERIGSKNLVRATGAIRPALDEWITRGRGFLASVHNFLKSICAPTIECNHCGNSGRYSSILCRGLFDVWKVGSNLSLPSVTKVMVGSRTFWNAVIGPLLPPSLLLSVVEYRPKNRAFLPSIYPRTRAFTQGSSCSTMQVRMARVLFPLAELNLPHYGDEPASRLSVRSNTEGVWEKS